MILVIRLYLKEGHEIELKSRGEFDDNEADDFRQIGALKKYDTLTSWLKSTDHFSERIVHIKEDSIIAVTISFE